eukprot:3757300-Pleurochrysis_carterae.AAC.1
MDYGNETIDVDGIGLRFMSVNAALSAMADDAVDDQGEQTDETLDGTQLSTERDLPPHTPRLTSENAAASLFETPT